MYLKFYGLKREPFHITPDPFFFYLGPSHREAFAALIYAIKNKKGFVAITGEVGLGKTTVIRTFLQQYKKQKNLKVLFIFNTKLSFKNLLKLILLELGIEKEKLQSLTYNTDEDFEVEAIQLLYHNLIEDYKKGINVVLILDEAQNLPIATLEKLRLISNLETDRNKLIQIFLIGQPELDKKLSLKNLRQLTQRIELRVKLTPFKKGEVAKYIDYRLKKAGYAGPQLFTKGAIKKICKYSNGIPRKINVICDNALINGFSLDKKKIDTRIIKEVCQELYDKDNIFSIKKIIYIIIFLVIFSTSFYIGTHVNDLTQISLFKNNQSIITQLSKVQNNTPKIIDKSTMQNNTSLNKISVTEQKKHIYKQALYHTDNNTESYSISTQTILKKTTKEPYEDKLTKSYSNNTINTSKAIKLKNKLLTELDTRGKIIYLILDEKFPFFKKLSEVRQIVLVEMAKQTSIGGLMTFKKMLAALGRGDYNAASKHMLYSTWYERVGLKAYELAKIMKTNNMKLLIDWINKYRIENHSKQDTSNSSTPSPEKTPQ